MTERAGWYYAEAGQAVGPFGLGELASKLRGVGGENTLVYGPGVTDWIEARHIPALADAVRGDDQPPSPPQARRGQDLEYEILGSEMQYVQVTLDPGETVVAEAGSLMYMTAGIKMETVFGDPSVETGFLGKVMSAGKRMLTGESLFMTTFTNESRTAQQAAFAAPYPGKILPLHLEEFGGELICQKDSFLCAARGVQIGIAFQKRVGVGLFGGEGFIMQRLTGDRVAMLHAGGTLMKRTLREGEVLKLDTGCLVAITPSIEYDIQFIGGIKNTLFGGEGLFFCTLTGPGDVWCQSLPFARLAGRVLANASGIRGGKGEGSLLGGLGDMLMGDNQ